MNNLNKYYFTFGLDECFPYQGGWVEIYTKDIEQAQQVFKTYYPNNNEFLNCNGYYTEKQFKNTSFKEGGNLGAFCHEIIAPVEINPRNLECYITRVGEHFIVKINNIDIPGVTNYKLETSDNGNIEINLKLSGYSSIFESEAMIEESRQ